MEIDKKIQEIQEELVKVLTKGYKREEVIFALEQLDLDKDMAIELLESFEQMNKDKEIVRNAWNTAQISDFATDIEACQKKESKSTRYFEEIHNKTSLMILAKKVQPEEINEELLDKLYNENIKESQIDNSSLKIAFHYYNESRKKEEKLVQIANENIKLKTFDRNLQNILRLRIASDEKHYQEALAKIELLNNKLLELQNRGILKTIGHKIAGIFGNKKDELPDASGIPKTLYENVTEKMNIKIYGGENKYEVPQYIDNEKQLELNEEEIQQ